jgi:hypothetical protein
MFTVVFTVPLCVTVCVFDVPVTLATSVCPAPALAPDIELVKVLESPSMVIVLEELLVNIDCVTVLLSPVMVNVLLIFDPLMVLVTVFKSPVIVIVLVTLVQAVVPSPQVKVI